MLAGKTNQPNINCPDEIRTQKQKTMNGNNFFPAVNSPNPNGCGTSNVPYYNTYSPAFACPGENQGISSQAIQSQPLLFSLNAPTPTFFVASDTATRYIIFGEGTDSACARLALEGLPDGTVLLPAESFEQGVQANIFDCVVEDRMVVGTMIITPSNSAVTQLNGQQTYPNICNPCFNNNVIFTCTGSCANQLVATNLGFGRGASVVLIVPPSTDLTIQICAGCQVETPSFTACGVPQVSQAQVPVANYCPPNGQPVQAYGVNPAPFRG